MSGAPPSDEAAAHSKGGIGGKSILSKKETEAAFYNLSLPAELFDLFDCLRDLHPSAPCGEAFAVSRQSLDERCLWFPW